MHVQLHSIKVEIKPLSYLIQLHLQISCGYSWLSYALILLNATPFTDIVWVYGLSYSLSYPMQHHLRMCGYASLAYAEAPSNSLLQHPHQSCPSCFLVRISPA